MRRQNSESHCRAHRLRTRKLEELLTLRAGGKRPSDKAVDATGEDPLTALALDAPPPVVLDEGHLAKRRRIGDVLKGGGCDFLTIFCF